MTTLIELHVLQNFAPANLNRDDTGAPKEAFFGGVRRARISSQCLKRAVRGYFGSGMQQSGLAPEELGQRTKRLRDRLVELLVGLGRAAEEVEERVVAALTAVELKLTDDGKSQYLLFLGNREIEALANIIHEQWDRLAPGAAPEDSSAKKRTKKQAAAQVDPDVRKALDAVFDGGKAVDVALFGRMLADMPERNQHAACQVAHAISTHAVEREFDFYTAVDDLKPEDSSGADMMGTVEFNSACYYRYAVIDWDKLVENLQGDSELARRGVRAFAEGFVVSEPTGKQNSFAAHSHPEFVALTQRVTGGARSYVNAFEVPIRARHGESLTRLSADALMAKARRLSTAYGMDRGTTVLDLTGVDPTGFGNAVDSLAALLDEGLAGLGGA